MAKLFIIHFILLFLHANAFAQNPDTTIINLHRLPEKYINELDKKITQYSNRITIKTEKTLEKLSRWENKIHGLMQKINPEAAGRLFGSNQLTFTSLLQKIRDREAFFLPYQQTYSRYTDNVTTSLQYLAMQKGQLDSDVVKRIKAAGNGMQELTVEESKSDALHQFMKERKKQLAEQALQYAEVSKYLAKIDKEAWYYGESIANYKELFSDSKKAETAVKTILNKIPAFQQFIRKNSLLASLFSQPDNVSDIPVVAGLQTRQAVQNLIQDRIASGGANALQQIQQNIQEAKDQVAQIKERLFSKLPTGSEGGEIPDFKPNMQKTKTFLQRLEYGYDLQFSRNNNLLPTTSDIAFTIGYKINDKSVMGIGAAYKMGMGNIQHIKITHQGIGLRVFIDWKLKKQFFMSGGYELNHNAQFKNIEQLKAYDAWQRSALIGLTKKISINMKLFKGTSVQLLYDILSQEHVPVSQPLFFRMGYSF